MRPFRLRERYFSYESALLTLSTSTATQAHILANEVFRKWFDLDMPGRSEERVTVLDDRHDVYRDEDLRRIREKSTVIALSDRVALADVLKAA